MQLNVERRKISIKNLHHSLTQLRASLLTEGEHSITLQEVRCQKVKSLLTARADFFWLNYKGLSKFLTRNQPCQQEIASDKTIGSYKRWHKDYRSSVHFVPYRLVSFKSLALRVNVLPVSAKSLWFSWRNHLASTQILWFGTLRQQARYLAIWLTARRWPVIV